MYVTSCIWTMSVQLCVQDNKLFDLILKTKKKKKKLSCHYTSKLFDCGPKVAC